jgi:hypothetical protein
MQHTGVLAQRNTFKNRFFVNEKEFANTPTICNYGTELKKKSNIELEC